MAAPIKEVVELTAETYQPGATTPLIDAGYKTIKAVEKSLNGASINGTILTRRVLGM